MTRGRAAAGLSLAVAARLRQDARVRLVETLGRDSVRFTTIGLEPDEIERMANDAVGLFTQPVIVGDDRCDVAIAVGVAVASGGGHDEVALEEEAEHALVEALAVGKSVVRPLGRSSCDPDRLALMRDLSGAIAASEFLLQYQPKMHVRQHTVSSVEALIRWQHPRRGMIPPGDFIPLAEDGLMISDVTLWTIRRAIDDQRVMRARGHDVRVFVNIAGSLLSDEVFIRTACDMIVRADALIGFEVTETSVIRDPEVAIAHLEHAASLGVVVAIDDYGAGLSSLAYLKRLPAKELKIDKLFVTQLTSSNRDPLIVRSTIDLAHALEMEVVAEGVESAAALALLSVMGCDMAQGYLISRPLALDKLLCFLDEGGHIDATEASRNTFQKLAAAWKRS